MDALRPRHRRTRTSPDSSAFSPSLYHGGAQNYGSAFLPASFQGTRIGDGGVDFKDAKLSNLIPSDDLALQRLQLDLLARRNRAHLERVGDAPEFEARIAAFETAYRMQSEAPEVMDLSRETAATHALYGVGSEPTDEYARQCLLARRCLEAGVRFVQINFSYTRNYWDAHSGLRDNHTGNAKKVDQPIAAFLTDLKTRGLLDDTLVIFGTEFGRTPATRRRTDGRDHHPHAFSVWMAGGGVRGGLAYGQTDEYGYYVAEKKVTMPDFHATILHLLGLNHELLTFRHAGRDYRLTDVARRGRSRRSSHSRRAGGCRLPRAIPGMEIPPGVRSQKAECCARQYSNSPGPPSHDDLPNFGRN